MSDYDVVLRGYHRLRDSCRPASAGPEGEPALSERQSRILELLDEEDPMMVTELAEYVGVTPSTMSLTLDRLERDGHVQRSRDPDDRRVVNIRLTETGSSARDRSSALDRERVEALLAALRPAARARAVEGLADLAEAADALVARGDRFVAALTGDAS